MPYIRPHHLRLLVAIGVLITIAGCGSSGGDHPPPKGGRGPGPGGEVAALLAGIPQRGNTLGYPGAPVTVEYFGDLQCPFCRLFTLGALRSLIKRYVRAGKLKIEYHSLKSATRDPEVFQVQQVAALAAGEQDRMWNYIELFYHEQGEEDSGYVTEGFLQGLAQQVPGLNLIAWTAARGDPRLVASLTGDELTAARRRMRSTPSFLMAESVRTPYGPAIRRLLSQ